MKNRFFISLAALMLASSLSAFADGVDMTDRIINADCESGLSGWNVTFTTLDNKNGYIWKSSSHTERGGDAGYYDFNSHCLEIWGGSNEVGANSISQVVRNLPTGTYVFGVPMAASIQSAASKLDPNADEVDGVYIFAGDNTCPVRTNNPSASPNEWAHTWKFNVAATVTDGTLRVGVGTEDYTNATFICIDNLTLYYFGDMDLDAALFAMRQIDIQKVVTVCEAVSAFPMYSVVRDRMTAAIQAAQAATTLEAAEAAEDELRMAKRAAVASAESYQPLADKLAEAREVAAAEWSFEVESYVEDLKALIVDCTEAYENGTLDSESLAGMLENLQNAIDMVKVDELWQMLDELELFVNRYEEISEETPSLFVGTSHPGFGSELGQFPEEQSDILQALIDEVQVALMQVEEGEMAASEAVKYIDKINTAVAHCIASRNSGNELPLTLITIPNTDGSAYYIESTSGPTSTDFDAKLRTLGIEPVESECEVGMEVFRYESPVILLDEHVDIVRFSVATTLFTQPSNKIYPYGRAHNSCNCGPYFNINEIYFYDATGEPIDITADMLSTNAQQGNEGPISGIVDRIIDTQSTTFFHSCYSSGTHPESGNHYIELAVPEGLREFSFAFEVIWENKYRLANIPVTINVEAISMLRSELDALLAEANRYNPITGTDPGFYTTDCSEFFAARAAAKALASDPDATDDAIIAAMERLEELIPTAEEAERILPEVGVEYCITSGAPFFEKQQALKNMTVEPFVIEDDTTFNMLRWTAANAADPYQRFVFEYVGTYGKYITAVIKNVGTGEYLGSFTGGKPGLSNQGFVITQRTETPDTLRIEDLGGGQCIIYAYAGSGSRYSGWMGYHCGDHNDGAYSTSNGNYGRSVYGQYGAIVQYNTGANGASAWFIRCMDTLPLTVPVEGTTVKTRMLHFDGGINTFALTGDKACAFGNLKLYDLLNNEISFTATSNSFVTTLSLEKACESLRIAFDNPEGISTLTITGGISRLSSLADAYEAALNKGYEEGEDVGCIKDLTAFNKAMAAAAKMLEEGNDDTDAINAAIQAIADAEASLEAVEPDPSKTYFIVSGYAEFFNHWGTEMGIYEDEKTNYLCWSYLGIDDSRYEWRFEPIKNDDPTQPTTYYITNVGTGHAIGTAPATGRSNPVMMSSSANVPYKLVPRADRMFNIVNMSEEADANWMFHPGYHDEGTRAFCSICFYGNETISKSDWYIREAGAARIASEVMPLVEPEAAPAVTGIYDLTGRRVTNPAAGLYIVNGKKVLLR